MQMSPHACSSLAHVRRFAFIWSGAYLTSSSPLGLAAAATTLCTPVSGARAHNSVTVIAWERNMVAQNAQVWEKREEKGDC